MARSSRPSCSAARAACWRRVESPLLLLSKEIHSVFSPSPDTFHKDPAAPAGRSAVAALPAGDKFHGFDRSASAAEAALAPAKTGLRPAPCPLTFCTPPASFRRNRTPAHALFPSC